MALFFCSRLLCATYCFALLSVPFALRRRNRRCDLCCALLVAVGVVHAVAVGAAAAAVFAAFVEVVGDNNNPVFLRPGQVARGEDTMTHTNKQTTMRFAKSLREIEALRLRQRRRLMTVSTSSLAVLILWRCCDWMVLCRFDPRYAGVFYGIDSSMSTECFARGSVLLTNCVPCSTRFGYTRWARGMAGGDILRATVVALCLCCGLFLLCFDFVCHGVLPSMTYDTGLSQLVVLFPSVAGVS